MISFAALLLLIQTIQQNEKALKQNETALKQNRTALIQNAEELKLSREELAKAANAQEDASKIENEKLNQQLFNNAENHFIQSVDILFSRLKSQLESFGLKPTTRPSTTLTIASCISRFRAERRPTFNEPENLAAFEQSLQRTSETIQDIIRCLSNADMLSTHPNREFIIERARSRVLPTITSLVEFFSRSKIEEDDQTLTPLESHSEKIYDIVLAIKGLEVILNKWGKT